MRDVLDEFTGGCITWDEAYCYAYNHYMSPHPADESVFWSEQIKELAVIMADRQMKALGYQLNGDKYAKPR